MVKIYIMEVNASTYRTFLMIYIIMQTSVFLGGLSPQFKSMILYEK